MIVFIASLWLCLHIVYVIVTLVTDTCSFMENGLLVKLVLWKQSKLPECFFSLSISPIRTFIFLFFCGLAVNTTYGPANNYDVFIT